MSELQKSLEDVYKSTLPYYFTGNNVDVFFDNIYVDECTMIGYRSVSNSSPTYAYNAELFNSITQGNFRVEGKFAVNFKSTGYIEHIILKGKAARKDSKYTPLGRVSPIETSKGFNTTSIDSILNSGKSTFLNGAITNPRMTGINDEDRELVRAKLRDYIWGHLKAGDEGTVQSLRDVLIGTYFDILVLIGNPNTENYDVKNISDAMILDVSIEVVKDMPLQLVYTFVARDVDKPSSRLNPFDVVTGNIPSVTSANMGPNEFLEYLVALVQLYTRNNVVDQHMRIRTDFEGSDSQDPAAQKAIVDVLFEKKNDVILQNILNLDFNTSTTDDRLVKTISPGTPEETELRIRSISAPWSFMGARFNPKGLQRLSLTSVQFTEVAFAGMTLHAPTPAEIALNIIPSPNDANIDGPAASVKQAIQADQGASITGTLLSDATKTKLTELGYPAINESIDITRTLQLIPGDTKLLNMDQTNSYPASISEQQYSISGLLSSADSMFYPATASNSPTETIPTTPKLIKCDLLEKQNVVATIDGMPVPPISQSVYMPHINKSQSDTISINPSYYRKAWDKDGTTLEEILLVRIAYSEIVEPLSDLFTYLTQAIAIDPPITMVSVTSIKQQSYEIKVQEGGANIYTFFTNGFMYIIAHLPPKIDDTTYSDSSLLNIYNIHDTGPITITYDIYDYPRIDAKWIGAVAPMIKLPSQMYPFGSSSPLYSESGQSASEKYTLADSNALTNEIMPSLDKLKTLAYVGATTPCYKMIPVVINGRQLILLPVSNPPYTFKSKIGVYFDGIIIRSEIPDSRYIHFVGTYINDTDNIQYIAIEQAYEYTDKVSTVPIGNPDIVITINEPGSEMNPYIGTEDVTRVINTICTYIHKELYFKDRKIQLYKYILRSTFHDPALADTLYDAFAQESSYKTPLLRFLPVLVPSVVTSIPLFDPIYINSSFAIPAAIIQDAEDNIWEANVDGSTIRPKTGIIVDRFNDSTIFAIMLIESHQSTEILQLYRKTTAARVKVGTKIYCAFDFSPINKITMEKLQILDTERFHGVDTPGDNCILHIQKENTNANAKYDYTMRVPDHTAGIYKDMEAGSLSTLNMAVLYQAYSEVPLRPRYHKDLLYKTLMSDALFRFDSEDNSIVGALPDNAGYENDIGKYRFIGLYLHGVPSIANLVYHQSKPTCRLNLLGYVNWNQAEANIIGDAGNINLIEHPDPVQVDISATMKNYQTEHKISDIYCTQFMPITLLASLYTKQTGEYDPILICGHNGSNRLTIVHPTYPLTLYFTITECTKDTQLVDNIADKKTLLVGDGYSPSKQYLKAPAILQDIVSGSRYTMYYYFTYQIETDTIYNQIVSNFPAELQSLNSSEQQVLQAIAQVILQEIQDEMNVKQPFEEDAEKYRAPAIPGVTATYPVKRTVRGQAKEIAKTEQGQRFVRQFLLSDKKQRQIGAANAPMNQMYPGSNGRMKSYLLTKDDWHVSMDTYTAGSKFYVQLIVKKKPKSPASEQLLT